MELMNISGNVSTPDPSAESLSSIVILEVVVQSLHFVLGLSVHSYVLFLLVTGTGSGFTSEFFNLNLNVCEIFYSLQSLLSLLKKTVDYKRLAPPSNFLLGMAFTGRPVFHCLICVERFLAVVHPVTFLKLKPLRYRIFCCSVAWSAAFLSCFFCMFNIMTNKRQSYSVFFTIQLPLLVLIQLFCLVSVLRVLKQSGSGERKEENRRKRRAFLIILVTSVNMVVMLVPYALTGLVSTLTGLDYPDMWFVGFLCFILTGFVQPLHYLQRNGKLSLFCPEN